MNTCSWGGIHVELGDLRRPVDSIAGFEERFKALKLPMNPALLDYGYFRESTLAPLASAARAIAGTLARTGTPAERIDMVIIATARPEFLAAESGFFPDLFKVTGLARATPLAVTGQECASLLSALDLAVGLVRAGRYRNILVVSQDRAKSESARIQSFGVVSDAAAACLVSGDESLEFVPRRFSLRTSLAGMGGGDDFAGRRSLVVESSADVLGPEGITFASVDKVFATNFFKPLLTFNASSTGVSASQFHNGTARDIGHCLNADPLLNLSNFLANDGIDVTSATYLLQAFAPGFLAVMLLQYRGIALANDSAAGLMEDVIQAW